MNPGGVAFHVGRVADNLQMMEGVQQRRREGREDAPPRIEIDDRKLGTLPERKKNQRLTAGTEY